MVIFSHATRRVVSFIWTGKYKNNRSISERNSFIEIRKPRKTSEQQAGRSNLSYKRETEPEDW